MFENYLFLVSSFITITGCMLVVFTKNLMHACVFLLMTLIGVSGLFLTLNADFVAITQLVVYVGGVVVLAIFAIMLTGGNDTESLNKFGIERVPGMGNSKTYIFAGITAAFLLFIIFVFGKFGTLLRQMPIRSTGGPYSSKVEVLGTKLLTDHVLAFEISSVLLLGALIGAAIIARPGRNEGA